MSRNLAPKTRIWRSLYEYSKREIVLTTIIKKACIFPVPGGSKVFNENRK